MTKTKEKRVDILSNLREAVESSMDIPLKIARRMAVTFLAPRSPTGTLRRELTRLIMGKN